MKGPNYITLVLVCGFIAITSACTDQFAGTGHDATASEVESVTIEEVRIAASKASRGGSIWADGRLFGTVGTPAHFEPGRGPFDELYNTGGNGTFRDGVDAISESKPGDQDFNGGRWHVNLLRSDVDMNKYANATSVDDLELDDFVSTDTYFECPLLPRK